MRWEGAVILFDCSGLSEELKSSCFLWHWPHLTHSVLRLLKIMFLTHFHTDHNMQIQATFICLGNSHKSSQLISALTLTEAHRPVEFFNLQPFSQHVRISTSLLRVFMFRCMHLTDMLSKVMYTALNAVNLSIIQEVNMSWAEWCVFPERSSRSVHMHVCAGAVAVCASAAGDAGQHRGASGRGECCLCQAFTGTSAHTHAQPKP